MADFGTLFSNTGKGTVKKVQKNGNDKIVYIHYSKLEENPRQYRKFSQQDVEEMGDLIAASGKVLQPLLVRKTDADVLHVIFLLPVAMQSRQIKISRNRKQIQQCAVKNGTLFSCI